MEITVKETAFDKYAKASEILKAISYPYRLEIIKLLDDLQYHPVFEIQAATGLESTLLSHHLNKMKDKGVLESNRDGRFIHYRLAIKEIIKVLDCIDNCEL